MTATTPTAVSMHDRLRMDYRWTPRQREVLSLISAGKTNAEIGEALHLSLAGAKWHVSEVMSKLQAASREEAGEYWRHYNGLAPRFARTFRGIVSAGALKWLIGAATLGATAGVVAVAATLLDEGSEEQAGGAVETPAAVATPQPTPTASTPEPFEGVLAGITITKNPVDVSPFDICAGGLEPLSVPQARAVASEPGGRLAVDPARLPAGLSISDISAPDVFVCGSDPVTVVEMLRVTPGTPNFNPGGGTIVVMRESRLLELRAGAPRDRWRLIDVGGLTGVVEDPLGGLGPGREGCRAALWDPSEEVFTSIDAFTALTGAVCEELLRAIVE